MKPQPTDGLLKIGELAKAAGVSVSTAKYYVSQDFLQPALKTSANMAWYHPHSVERIRLIKRLQKEWFLPLSVIGDILSGHKTEMDVGLYEAIYKVTPASEGGEVPLHGAVKETGLSRDQLHRLLDAGVVRTTAGARGRRVFDTRNLRILRLVRQRCQAGLPFAQTLESFTIYTRALDEAARLDVDAMVRQVILQGARPAGEVAQLIRLADDTLDEFMAVKREQLDSLHSSERIRDLSGYILRLGAFAAWLPGAWPCEGPEWATAIAQLTALEQVNRDMDIAVGGAVCHEAGEYFWQLDPAAAPLCQPPLAALRLAFFTLAPAMFGWASRAQATRQGFESAWGAPDADRRAFAKKVQTKLEELRNTVEDSNEQAELEGNR